MRAYWCYGLLSLIEIIYNNFLDTTINVIPLAIMPAVNLYFLALVACAPLLLLFFIINQPKIINKVSLVVELRQNRLAVCFYGHKLYRSFYYYR